MSLVEEINANMAASSPARYSEKDLLLEIGVPAQSWQGSVADRLSAFREFVKNVESQACRSPKFCSAEISTGYALLFHKEDAIAT